MKIILAVIACAAGITLVVFLAIGLLTVVKSVVVHLFRFIGAELRDLFRAIGAVITSCLYAFLLLGNIVIGRWSAATHFGRGIRDEISGGARALYRVVIGNPARLFLMKGLVEGIEDRLPAMVQAAPGTDGPSKRSGQFDGYRIQGSLPTGGSGSKLYIAEPDPMKRAGLERAGHHNLTQVVIKCFSLADGSSLPQIVRESRALDAAMKLGLILDHDLATDRFFYVMRFVPGQNLTLVTKQLHAQCEGNGLDAKRLRLGLGFVMDLLKTLDRYHQGGLWHKDVKPDNIIVEGEAAHLVDFGLVTPLRSAMTLTTHGTEYFRDPEMVRLALKGMKVHEVDGTRFDIFGVGAVLYAILEDGFPAHGVLSPISKNCPEALKWVIRRAMTDYDKRYVSASAMLADVEAVRLAADPFTMRPIDLPSMRANGAQVAPAAPVEVAAPAAATFAAAAGAFHAAPSPVPPPANSSGMAQPASNGFTFDGAKPKIIVENWWTGKSSIQDPAQTPAHTSVGSASAADALNSSKEAARHLKRSIFAGIEPSGARRHSPRPADMPRRPATEQVASARARAQAARDRAHARLQTRERSANSYSNGVKGVVAIVFVLFVGAVGGLGVLAFTHKQLPVNIEVSTSGSDSPQTITVPLGGGADFAGLAAFVISDLDALDPTSASEARDGLRRLRESGLKVAGLPVDTLLGEADLNLQTSVVDEMSATLRIARGQASLDSKAGIDAVRTWLLKHSEQFDMVVWLAKEPGGEGADGLFHFITFKDSAKPGTLGFTAQQLIDGIIEPGKRAIQFSVKSGRDVQKLLEDLGTTIANAKQSVANSLDKQSPATGPPGDEQQRGITGEARDYVLRLVNDAGKILSAVRSSVEDRAASTTPPDETTPEKPNSEKPNPKSPKPAKPNPRRRRLNTSSPFKRPTFTPRIPRVTRL